MGIDQVTVSGGDPLTHPEILLILRGLTTLGVSVKLDTVGTVFLGDGTKIFYGRGESPRLPITEIVGAVDVLGLPIDGPTDSILQEFRAGRASLLSEVVAIIRLATRAGIRVCVNTVVHSRNIDTLSQIMTIAVEAGAKEWQIFEFTPIGPLGSRNAERFALQAGEFVAATRDVHRVAARLGLNVVVKEITARLGVYFLIDDAGVAWLPDGAKRQTLGHITHERPQVLDHLRSYVEVRH